MRRAIKKCKNCNDIFSKGRSDKIFCEEKCRYKYNYKIKTQKKPVNKNREMFNQILSDITFLDTYFRHNVKAVESKFKISNNNSNESFEMQMKLLEHYDYLSRLRRIKKCFQLNIKK